MTKPAKKIWCPQCHKRHRLPANAKGIALRCRGCKFAFLAKDGLQVDPNLNKAVPDIASPKNKVLKSPARVRRKRQLNVSESSKEIGGGSNAGSGTAILDNEYDDILSVLDTPTNAHAPSRAIARTPTSAARTVVTAEDLAEEPERPPITRDQLRSYRNARQFWMLMSFLAACVLGLCCFVYVNVLMSPEIGSWEREILYSFGVPARWLPPAANEDESLPSIHVKLRGDHAELADRNDFFRDDFEDELAAKGDVKKEVEAEKNAFDRGPRVAKEVGPRRDAAAPGMNMNRVPRRQPARKPVVQWSPPELSAADLQRIVSRGIDPKFLRSVTIGESGSPRVVSADTLFHIDGKGHLVAWSTAEGGKQIAHRKLDSEFAAVCLAPRNEISDRPAVWIHFGNGNLQKWELDGADLSPSVRIANTKAVFKERRALLTANDDRIAFVHQGSIVAAGFLPTAGRIVNPVEISVDGDLFALKLARDNGTLLAVTNNKILKIDSLNGETKVEFDLPLEYQRSVSTGTQTVFIDQDLNTIYFVRNGLIDSVELAGEVAQLSGQYWSSSPLPIGSVLGFEDSLAGVSVAGDITEVTFFNKSKMRRSNFVSRKQPPARKKSEKSPNPRGGLVRSVTGVPSLPQQPFLNSLSPKLNQEISDLKFANGKVAFLVGKRNNRRLAIADIENSWNVVALDINVGEVSHFSVSPDFRQLVVSIGEVVQSWRIDDVATGKATLVAEFAGHVDDVTAIALMPEGKSVLSGDRKGNIYSWEFESGVSTGLIQGLRSEVLNISAYSETAFVAMDRMGKVKGSLKTQRKLVAFPRPVTGATAISPNGSKVAFNFGNEVKIANSNFRKFESVGNSQSALRLEFAKDQRHILLGDREQVSLWNIRKKQQVRRFRIPGMSRVGAFSVSKDGSSVAVVVGAEANQIAIFELPGLQ